MLGHLDKGAYHMLGQNHQITVIQLEKLAKIFTANRVAHVPWKASVPPIRQGPTS